MTDDDLTALLASAFGPVRPVLVTCPDCGDDDCVPSDWFVAGARLLCPCGAGNLLIDMVPRQ